MDVVALALLSSVTFSLGNVIARAGLKGHASPFSSTVMFFSASIIMWAITFIGGFAMPSLQSLPIYVIRGIVDPGIAAILVFISLRKLGASLTIPILMAAALVSTLLSVIFLNERLTWFIAAGTLLIIAGVCMLSFNHGSFHANKKYVFVAIMASLAVGIGNFLTKVALNSSNAPVGGVCVSFAAGMAVHLLFIALRNKWNELPLSWKASRVFLLAGIFIGAAFAFMFLAFSTGNVSIVAPLLATQPLFVLLFSYFLLRADEKITKNVVIGTLMIVAGAALLTLL